MKLKNKKIIPIGIAMGIILATVGTVGALNGWFGGGNKIPEDTMTRGLVGYWNFDEGSGTTIYDNSGNRNNGTITSAPKWIAGKVGDALQFDGVGGNEAYISNFNIDNYGAVTVEMWFKTTNLSKMQNLTYRDGQFYIYINEDGAGSIAVTSIGLSSDWSAWYAGSALTANVWHHLVFIYNGSQKILYFDGAQLGSSVAATGNFTAGQYEWLLCLGTAYQLNGAIDEYRVYNRALTAGEVRYHYNRGGPVAYWPFDSGSGSVAYDSTENNNDGILYGGMATSTAEASGWKSGKYGTALAFDGVNDYVDAGNSSSTNMGTSNFTIEAWIKTNSAGGGYGRIVDKAYDTGYIVAVSNSYGNNGSLSMSIGGTFTQGRTGAKDLRDSQWHHVTVVFNRSSNAVYYVDGKIDGSPTNISSKSATNLDNSTNLKIGNGTTGDAPFAGLIDEVRIYKYARTPDEIALDYNQGFAVRFGQTGATCDVDPASCITKGLVGSWNFDEGSGSTSTDLSGNGNNGTLTNGPQWTKGKVGGALSFDGKNDYVDAGRGESLQTNNVITLEAWVKTSKRNWNTIVWKDNYGTNGYFFGTDDGGYLYFFMFSSTTLRATSSRYQIADGNWHHVLAAYDGYKIFYYVDGLNVYTYSWGSYLALGNDPNYSVRISYPGGGSEFNGLIDEVRIYNRALSAEEVRYHYNQGEPIGYWKFDEGSGSVAYDSTESNYDGIIYGGMGTSTADGSGWKAGKYGSALAFDGVDDYVDMGNVLTTDRDKDRTYSVWVKPTAQNYETIFSTGNLSVFKAGYSVFTILSRTQLNIAYDFDVTPYVAQVNCSTDLNKWNHLEFVIDLADASTTNIKVYKNGAFCAETNQIRSAGSRQYTSFVVGAETNGFPTASKIRLFNGFIDDVRVYNYTRTPSQIQQDYNQGFAARFGQSDTTCSADPASCLTKGLVGYWNFDEGGGSTSTDLSGNGNNGTLTNGPQWTKGKVGGALSFDGINDTVQVPNSASMNISNNVTVEAWVKTSANMGGWCCNYHNIFNKYGSATINFGISYNTEIYAYFSDGTNTLVSRRYTSDNPVNNGQWHHIVGIKDGINGYLYYDGVLFATSTNSLIGSVANTVNPSIGFQVNGVIDEVRFYNRPLSAEEVMYHYNKGKPVAQWAFDEGSGNTVYDSSGNGNNGIIYGGMATSTADGSGWKSGKYGTALAFDGVNDYVGLPAFSLSGTVLTTEVWLKSSPNVNYQTIIGDNSQSSAVGFIFFLRGDSNNDRLYWQYAYGAGYGWANSDNFFTGYNNTWVHATIVCDYANKTIDFYRNGVFVNRVNMSGTPVFPSTSRVRYIGDYSAEHFYPFKGSIDDVRIYSYARTASQIQQDYNAGLGTYFK